MNKANQLKLSQDEIFNQVKGIIIKLYDVSDSEVVPEAKLSEDLQADSLEQLEFIMELGNTFGFTVPDQMDMDIITVQDSVNWVAKHIAA